ncbi:MAG: pimeloyl-ACP methyl ester carboxylesterase, partial [Candidatus Latescibacterota bacterium]
DLRGHGQTPLPDDREVLLIEDLENSFLDVHATLNWLLDQQGINANRIAVIGTGSGGNVAYVSSGVFPQQIRTGISLSPGLWEATSLGPLVVGSGIDPFIPRSMLFMVGAQDELQGPDTLLSYADFARNLEATTADPKSLRVFQNSAAHGIDLINNVPEAMDLLFLWLENNL